MSTPLSSVQDWLLGRSFELFAQPAGSVARVPEPKGNPFGSYTSAVLSTGIVVSVLFVLLIIGGMLFVNWAFLSKRKQDRTGGRNPSDVAILKENIWPEAPYEEKEFPAMVDDEEQSASESVPTPHSGGTVANIRAYRERAKQRRLEAERLIREGGQEGPPGVRVMHSQAGNPVIEHDIPSVEDSENEDGKS